MADGITHDQLILQTTPIAAALCALVAPDQAVVFSISHLIGGLYLSPDLDTPSRPFNRWGPLKSLWIPYQKVMPHRGKSHSILIGTLGRVAYLAVPIVVGLVAGGTPFTAITAWVALHAHRVLFCVMGLEFSAWVHLYADGILLKGKKRRRGK